MQSRQLLTYNCDDWPRKKNSVTTHPSMPNQARADESKKPAKGGIFSDLETSSAFLSKDGCVCVDFSEDMLRYTLHRQCCYALPRDFLASHRRVTPRMRTKIVDFLVLIHSQLDLRTETFWLCNAMVDRCLMACDVMKGDLQILLLAALHLAAKVEELYACTLGDLRSVCGVDLADDKIISVQNELLRVLGFDLNFVLPCTLLRYFTALCSCASTREYCLASYCLNVANSAYESCHWLPSEMALVSLNLALTLNGATNVQNFRLLTTFLDISQANLNAKTRTLAMLLLKNQDDTKSRSIFEKYSKREMFHCAELNDSMRLAVEQLAELAE